jgi:hypothetical protein
LVSRRRLPRPKRVAVRVAALVLAVPVAAAARALEAVRGQPVAAVPQAAEEVLVAAAVLPDRAVAAE